MNQPFQSSPPAGAMYVGVVENVVLDANGCLKVRIAALNGIFDCRVAMPMAGAGRGMVFLPEKADQVLVGCVAGSDVEFVMLGGLWSANARPPELEGAPANDTKVIRTRGGNVIRLVDTDGEERIEIVTPGGASVRVNGAGVEIHGTRITLEGDVKVRGLLRVESGDGHGTTISGNEITGE